MKIRLASVLIILSLLTGHAARAADWEVVASPNAGRQANSLSSVAAVADNDVWAVGWAFNQSLFAYRTLTEHWNGTRWSIMESERDERLQSPQWSRRRGSKRRVDGWSGSHRQHL